MAKNSQQKLIEDIVSKVRRSSEGLPLKKLVRHESRERNLEFTASSFRETKRLLSDVPGILIANGIVLAEPPDIDDPDASVSLPKDTTPPTIEIAGIGPLAVGASNNAIIIDKITGLLTDPIRYISDTSSQLYRDTMACKYAIGSGAACPRPSFEGNVGELVKGAVSVTFDSVTNQTRTLSGTPNNTTGRFSIPISFADIQFMGRGEHLATFRATDAAGNVGTQSFTFYVAVPYGLMPQDV